MQIRNGVSTYPADEIVACSRRSDSGARAKTKASERAGKNEGRLGESFALYFSLALHYLNARNRPMKSKQVRFRIFKFASRKLLLFVVIVLYSRNKSFPRNPYSRVSKNSSSVSKLETRSSILETRASILDSRKHRRSRIEFRVKTVNLLLPGTVQVMRNKEMITKNKTF